MSDLEYILQWVSITNKNGEPEITHQLDEEGNAINISHMLDLAEADELNVMIAIPANQRLGKEPPVGNPFVAVDMKTGLFNVNGTNWDFMPSKIDPSEVKFRPIWYHSVRKDFSTNSPTLEMKPLGQRITLYKIGWQFTYEEKNYQRILFFNVETGTFSLKEKR